MRDQKAFTRPQVVNCCPLTMHPTARRAAALMPDHLIPWMGEDRAEAAPQRIWKGAAVIDGTKLRCGSNTTQDSAAMAKPGPSHPSTWAYRWRLELSREAIHHLARPLGRIIRMNAIPITSAMRGLHTVNDLAAQAML